MFWLLMAGLTLVVSVIWLGRYASTSIATMSGHVVAVERGRSLYKFPGRRASSQLRVKLANEELVDVTVPEPGDLSAGDDVVVAKRVTPWGQVWFSLEHK